ncbi:hypothetical protein GCM10025783_12180 [Amnibacterium soli]|uniref:SIMPL domain-containing protein n=1 Tax=Amnibacterium soli TaxID=1282736 RepID=A0ABP8YXH0_9MICO
MVLIAVHGRAAVHLPAERGTVLLAVEREHEDRATAVAQVAALHERLSHEAQAFLDEGAAARWSSDQVQVRAEHRHDGPTEARRLVQIAAARLEVRFRDLDALSAWVQRIGEEPGVVVFGVDWTVTAAVRAAGERAAREGAVRDATERAADYAHAAGLGDPVLAAVWEDGLRRGSSRADTGWVAQSKAARLDGMPALVLRPDAIAVAAAVTADFEVAGAPPSAS